MKKTYINPSMLVVRLGMTLPLAGSGVQKTLGDEYTSTDVSYTKGTNDVNVWDDEW